jgi:hypothetical protein
MRAICCLVISGLLATSAWSASIGLFSTSDCSSCNLDVPQGETRTFYISVLTEELPPWVTAITGAEFKVIGLPDAWNAVSTPNPAANVVEGDPLGAVGARIAFPVRMEGTCITLFSVEVTVSTSLNDVTLQVTHRTPSTNPTACPFVLPDCEPGPCPFSPPPCVAGGEMFINSETDCTVSVENTTWSVVKRVYDG